MGVVHSSSDTKTETCATLKEIKVTAWDLDIRGERILISIAKQNFSILGTVFTDENVTILMWNDWHYIEKYKIIGLLLKYIWYGNIKCCAIGNIKCALWKYS